MWWAAVNCLVFIVECDDIPCSPFSGPEIENGCTKWKKVGYCRLFFFLLFMM